MIEKLQALKKSPVFLSYMVVFGIILFVYMQYGVYPFGANHIVRIDAFHAYAPRINEFIGKLRSGESLFYSWRGGVGLDYYFLFVTSLLNPFVLVGLLFDSDSITDVMALIYLIQIPVIAASFAYFLKTKYLRNDLIIVAFSIMYGLSSFVTAFFWVYYWLPVLAILPFVALGLDKLIKTGDYRMYAVSLGLGIVSNYLFGMFLCYFSFIYYTVENMSMKKGVFANKIFWKYAISSICAVAVGAVALVPAIINMGNTSYGSAGNYMPGIEFFYSIPQVITAMLHGVQPSVLQPNSGGTPNIYTGVLALLLTALYCFQKNVSKRRKTVIFCVLLFLILASVVSTIGWVLNGLRYPSDLPHRFMFIYVFFIVMLSFESFMEVTTTSIKTLALAFGTAIFLIITLSILYPV